MYYGERIYIESWDTAEEVLMKLRHLREMISRWEDYLEEYPEQSEAVQDEIWELKYELERWC